MVTWLAHRRNPYTPGTSQWQAWNTGFLSMLEPMVWATACGLVTGLAIDGLAWWGWA